LINKICKLCLKAGETNALQEISADVVRQIAERFQKLAGPAMPKRKPRLRFSEESTSEESEDAIERMEPSAPVNEERKVVTLNDRIVQPEPPMHQEKSVPESTENESEEMMIDKYNVNVSIPTHVMEQALSFSDEHRARLAGVLAAQTMQKHPQLTVSAGADPVTIWSEIRESILFKFKQQQENAVGQG